MRYIHEVTMAERGHLAYLAGYCQKELIEALDSRGPAPSLREAALCFLSLMGTDEDRFRTVAKLGDDLAGA
jgi:hypothetical protein